MDTDHLPLEARMRNTPERVRRIEEFAAHVKFFPVDGQVQCGLSFTEPVVVNRLTLRHINATVSQMIKQHGEAAVMHMQSRLTNEMRQALIGCHALFEDEAQDEPEFVADDTQAVRLSGEGVEVIDSNWG